VQRQQCRSLRTDGRGAQKPRRRQAPSTSKRAGALPRRSPAVRPRGPSPTKKPPPRPALRTCLLLPLPLPPAPTAAPRIVLRRPRPPRRPEAVLAQTPDDIDPIDTPTFVTPLAIGEGSSKRVRDESVGAERARSVRRRISLGGGEVSRSGSGAAEEAVAVDNRPVDRLSPALSPSRFSLESSLPRETVRETNEEGKEIKEDDCNDDEDFGDDAIAASGFNKRLSHATPLCAQPPQTCAGDGEQNDDCQSEAEVAETPQSAEQCITAFLPETPGAPRQEPQSLTAAEESPVLLPTAVANGSANVCPRVPPSSVAELLSPGLFSRQPELFTRTLSANSSKESSDVADEMSKEGARCASSALHGRSRPATHVVEETPRHSAASVAESPVVLVHELAAVTNAARATACKPVADAAAQSLSPGLFSGQRPLTMRSNFTLSRDYHRRGADSDSAEKADDALVAVDDAPVALRHDNSDAIGAQGVVDSKDSDSGGAPSDSLSVASSPEEGRSEPIANASVSAAAYIPRPIVPSLPSSLAKGKDTNGSAASRPWPFCLATVPPETLPLPEVRVRTPVVPSRSPSTIGESAMQKEPRAQSLGKHNGASEYAIESAKMRGYPLAAVAERQPLTFSRAVVKVLPETRRTAGSVETGEQASVSVDAALPCLVACAGAGADADGGGTSKAVLRVVAGTEKVDTSSYASTAPPPEEPSEWIRAMQEKMDRCCDEMDVGSDDDVDDEDMYRPCRIMRVAYAAPAVYVSSSDSEMDVDDEQVEEVISGERCKSESEDNSEGDERCVKSSGVPPSQMQSDDEEGDDVNCGGGIDASHSTDTGSGGGKHEERTGSGKTKDQDKLACSYLDIYCRCSSGRLR
jgi:hypothetical protein